MYNLKDKNGNNFVLTKEYLELSEGLDKYGITEVGQDVDVRFTSLKGRELCFNYHVCFIESDTKCYGYVREWSSYRPLRLPSYKEIINENLTYGSLEDFYICEYDQGVLERDYDPNDKEVDLLLENAEYVIFTMNRVKVVGNIGIITK